MKKTFYIALILFSIACKPKEPNIQNDQQTLDKVFAMEQFEVEIGQFGCFGGETDFFQVKKMDSKYKLTNLKTEKSIYVERDSINSLKQFLAVRLERVDKIPLCTGSMYFRAGTQSNSIDFNDESCRDWDVINQIVSFSEISSTE